MSSALAANDRRLVSVQSEIGEHATTMCRRFRDDAALGTALYASRAWDI